jgi:hypothetical protein
MNSVTGIPSFSLSARVVSNLNGKFLYQIVLGKYSVRIFVGSPVILTEVFVFSSVPPY